jgi:Asp-tRNA(Asn)/Glu-tRNA(Gln) amidotransferase A subunit family amidase
MQQQAPFHLQEATIDSIHGAMRAGQITCRQLVQAYLNRIEAYDQQGPALNSIETVNPNALVEADRFDAQFRAGGPSGPLHCIPVLVKDQVETNDMPTTYGSAVFKDFIPNRNATIIEKLKAAGALILAKNTMSEYALPGYHGAAFGFCRNAYDPTRSPGGSSCGTGVSVAANFGAVGVGEDTGGSVRTPAALNGLVGLRPTIGLISRFGMFPASPTRDTLGPMTRTVRDAAILLDALAGYDPHDPVTAYSVDRIPTTYTSFLTPDGLRGVRLGVIGEPIGTGIDREAQDHQEVRAAMERALADMAAQGAEIIDPVPIGPILQTLRSIVSQGETDAATGRYLADHPNAPVRTLQEIVIAPDGSVLPSQRAQLADALGKSTSDPEYLRSQITREQLRQQVLSTMADYGVDALVYPTLEHAPPLIPADILTRRERESSRGSNAALSSAVGFPALTVPAGFTSDGLPIGFSFFGRPFSEGLLLKMAYAYEQAAPRRQPPAATPPLPGEP